MKYTLIATHGKVKQDTINLANECQKYTDKVIFLVDEDQPLDYEYKKYPNIGFDFGKIYNWLKETELTEQDELCITNDTISPIASFEGLFKHCQNKQYEFTGGTSAYSNYKIQKLVDGRHIQSFFLYIKGKAVLTYKDYFMKYGIVNCKREGVEIYEMGVSMIMKKLYNCKAYIEADYIMKKYEQVRYDSVIFSDTKGKVIIKRKNGERNGTFFEPEIYLEEGLPFTKNTMFQYGFRPPLIQYLSNKIYGHNTSTKRGNK